MRIGCPSLEHPYGRMKPCGPSGDIDRTSARLRGFYGWYNSLEGILSILSEMNVIISDKDIFAHE
jgi:hypothetical protein